MSRVRVPFPAPFECRWSYLVSGIAADVAQSVERVLGKDEVTSSNLVIGSIISNNLIQAQLYEFS